MQRGSKRKEAHLTGKKPANKALGELLREFGYT